MNLSEREQQIWRIQQASWHNPLNEQLQQLLQERTLTCTRVTLEQALRAETSQYLEGLDREERLRCRRSGYFTRTTDTPYGRIEKLSVPKLRAGNKERSWQILTRHQRSLSWLVNIACSMFLSGLSIRDLQEVLYEIMGTVLSRQAINTMTLQIEAHLVPYLNRPIAATPPVILVDGVWVSIQYAIDQYKEDRAGHVRQCRQAQERVLLTAMALWPDGRCELLGFQTAEKEEEQTWQSLFERLIARGLNPQQVQLLVSDGSTGVLAAMEAAFPLTQLQRCITHKVRGMERYLSYQELPTVSLTGESLTLTEAKRQRLQEIQTDAYEIYKQPTRAQALAQRDLFEAKWQVLEPKAVHNFLWGFKRTVVFYDFPDMWHVHIRTTNHLERFFREFRTRADEFGAFSDELSCLTIFWALAQRYEAKKWPPSMAKNSRH
ncbi:MAG: transposase [Chloroflexi bacterium]|nr:transposase [Chloroflexota bacterium]